MAQYGKDVNGRITSTYVENTLLNNFKWTTLRDHLHIRGEYIDDSGEVEVWTGSPPHTWRIHFDWCC